MRRVAAAFVLCLILCAGSRAADRFDEARLIPTPGKASRGSDKPAESGRPKARNPAGTWWTTLGSLTAVLALVYLTAKVLRKSMPTAQRSLPVEVVQVLGRKALDYRNTIHLVRFGSRLLILGSSQQGLAPLGEISDPVEVDFLAGLCKPSEPGSVADTFQQLFRRFQSPEPDETMAEREPETDSDPAVVRLQARLAEPGGTAAADSQHVSFEEAAG